MHPLPPGPRERPSPQLHGSKDLRGASRSDAGHVRQFIVPGAGETVDATSAGEDRVREVEGARRSPSGAEHDRHELVVAEARGAKTL